MNKPASTKTRRKGDITAASLQLPAPSASEVAAIAGATERVDARRARVAVKMEMVGEKTMVSWPHADGEGFCKRLADAFGTSSQPFASSALNMLGNAIRSRASAETEDEMNAALAVVDGIRPRDEAEALLAVQMVATNRAALDMLARARAAEYMLTLTECGNLAVKLLRTYTGQIEALAKLRRGGEQTVRVEHVHVAEGAQAIVGNVSHPGIGGGEQRK